MPQNCDGIERNKTHSMLSFIEEQFKSASVA